jgi:ribosome-associated protein
VAMARGIRAHEGRRRQIQFIGKLMRDIDPVPVQAALDRWASGVPNDHARFAAAERWREQLLADDAALDHFMLEHPDADRGALASLVRDARTERQRGSPPHRYRELFRRLRKSAESAPEVDAPVDHNEVAD